MPTDSDSDARDTHGRYTPEYADEEILEAVREHAPASTKEIADAVGCSRQNADRRLRQLRERGAVASKKTGPALVWWLDDSAFARRLSRKSIADTYGDDYFAENPGWADDLPDLGENA
jgi:predicted ArsR family transcriptional regulator